MKAKKRKIPKAQYGTSIPYQSQIKPFSVDVQDPSKSFQSSGSTAAASAASAGLGMVGNMIMPGLGTALAMAPQLYMAVQGAKAKREAESEARDIKAMMPSMTSQEDYYNYYQKVAQSTNEAKMQNQLDQTLAAGSKTLQGAGTRGVLGGVQGAVGAAAQSKADIGQERQQQLLGAYEKMIGAKQQDRAMLQGELMAARQATTAGLQTQAAGLQGAADIAGQFLLGQSKKAEDGAAVKKSPGEFSHEKNPIDVVRDGKKIAEMTGGEYIFNPKQMEAIKAMVSGDDKTKLHSYMKKLIRTFEKRAVK